jgi:glycosyltransferase involved in cell wall biosynthesis
VSCCGWLSGAALGEAYASSDVLLFPSDVETFGNVTLEALASGCPCVVEEKCGGHLVTHGVNGFTCPAGTYVHINIYVYTCICHKFEFEKDFFFVMIISYSFLIITTLL